MPKFRLGDKVEFTSEGGYIWKPYSYKDYYGILVKKLSQDSSVWTVQVRPKNPQDFRFPLGPYTEWTFLRMYLKKYQPKKKEITK